MAEPAGANGEGGDPPVPAVYLLGAAEAREGLGLGAAALAAQVTDVINAAYVRGEHMHTQIWRPVVAADGKPGPAPRTNRAEVAGLLAEDRLVLLLAAEADLAAWRAAGEAGRKRYRVVERAADALAERLRGSGPGEPVVLGSVKCERLTEEECELGMLGVHQEWLRRGLGEVLIKAAEAKARRMGSSTMKLEILSPRDVEHPVKAMLKAWYTKRHGYVEAEQEDFAAGNPDLAPLLAVPCDFTVYRKPLALE